MQNHANIDDLLRLTTAIPISKIKILRETSTGVTYNILFEQNINVLKVVESLAENHAVIFVEPDFIGTTGGEQILLPNDTYFESRQWGLYNLGTFPLSPSVSDSDIDMEFAWELSTGDDELIIAILDSGLKLNHPEVKDNLWYNSTEQENGIDDDNNGYIDDVWTGWDFVNEDNNPTDDLGHGTNVTGIIGAKGDNDSGYAGVNWNSKLMNLKVINNNNSGFYSWWSEAIYYAVDNGAKVINMSLGGSSFSASMEEAVDYAYNNNVTIVACMMNTNTSAPYYPAAYDNTIAVGATNPNDERTQPFFWNSMSGSNFGAHIDLIAPGNFTYGLSYNSNTNFNSYWGGTSQAAPLVAGVASLLLSIDPDLSVDQIRELLITTAEDEVGKSSEDTPGFDNYHGHGRLNALQALFALTNVNQKEMEESHIYNVTPNPSKANSTIVLKWNDYNINKISISTLNGQLLETKSISAYQNTLDWSLDQLIKGVYLVMFYNNDSVKAVKRIVVE